MPSNSIMSTIGDGIRSLAVPAAYMAGDYVRRKGYYAKKVVKGQRNRAPKKTTGRARKRVAKQPGRARVVKNVDKRLTNLSRQVNASTGTLIFRNRSTNKALAAVNQTAYADGEIIQMSSYEAVLAQLRFFNPSAPATLIQGSGAVGTYTRDYLFSSIYTKVDAMNNYQVPCRCTMYLCTPKEDTNITPTTAFTNGLADVGNPSATSHLVFLSDSDEFTKLWKIHRSKTRILTPGQGMSIISSYKNMLYDPSVFDSHSLSYQRKYRCYVILVKVEGVLGHDTSADQQGFLQAGVDISADTKFVVTYDAGIDLKYIYVADASDSFTNGGVVSSKPVSDNLAYSVA